MEQGEFNKEILAENRTGFDYFTRMLISIVSYRSTLSLKDETMTDYYKRKSPELLKAAIKQIEINNLRNK